MSTIKTTDNELLAMEVSFTELTNRFIKEGFNPYACAAVMTKLAFMIYKSSMNTEDYNLMIDSISDSRDHIMTFSEIQNTSRLN